MFPVKSCMFFRLSWVGTRNQRSGRFSRLSLCKFSPLLSRLLICIPRSLGPLLFRDFFPSFYGLINISGRCLTAPLKRLTHIKQTRVRNVQYVARTLKRFHSARSASCRMIVTGFVLGFFFVHSVSVLLINNLREHENYAYVSRQPER